MARPGAALPGSLPSIVEVAVAVAVAVAVFVPLIPLEVAVAPPPEPSELVLLPPVLAGRTDLRKIG